MQHLQVEKEETIGTQNRLQSDLEDLKRSNADFEQENVKLVKERANNLLQIDEITAVKTQIQEKLAKS